MDWQALTLSLRLAAWTVVIPVALSLAGLADRTSGRDSGHSKPAR